MSIYTYIKADHDHFKELMSQIDSMDSDKMDKRDELFNTLKKEIILHSKAEEKIFYQPLQKDFNKEINHAQKEHSEVEEMLERLSDDSLNGAAWEQLFKSMKESLLHHIKEEEGEIFSDAKKELSSEKANNMEETMKEEKKNVEKQKKINFRNNKD